MSSVIVSANPGAGVCTLAKQAANNLLDLNRETFRARFDREPFIIGHHLEDHPLFTLPRLVELSRRLPKENVKYNAGNIPIGIELYTGPQTGLSAEETIRRIEECGSWMVLKWVEQDDEYRDLLNRCLDEVQALSEPIVPGMSKREAFIFVTSPRSITPYHMDPEYSFLLQIRGRKTVKVMPGSAVSEQELEDYFGGGCDPAFKEECKETAPTFRLTPGKGLHFPITVPHWVENGDEVSISFSITFRTLASERKSIVYDMNRRLRMRGLNPAPYGRSALRDSAKFYAFRAARRARKLLGLKEQKAEGGRQ
ncbi:MAG TPA: transcription factor [Blastocatellia bacterium]|nr:transcription factor [Blastocatellia bacterium]